MSELEKLQKAQLYIEKLANGIDPISNDPIKDDSVLNNIKIARCLFYINEVLKSLLKDGGKIKKAKTDFVYNEELIKDVYISERPISLTEIIRNVKKVYGDIKLSYQIVANLLQQKGILINNPFGQRPKLIPSQEASKLGILIEKRMGERGEYQVTLYDKNAQRLVLNFLKELQNE